jgi:hypothetical protein
MKHKFTMGTTLSRKEQKQIVGGTGYTCSPCQKINNFVSVCSMVAILCSTPDCNGYCNGRPNCFLSCSEGGLDL